MGSVADDDGRPPVDVAHERARGQVRRGPEVAPERAPEDERGARPLGAQKGGGQRDAARRPGHDGGVAPARGHLVDLALGDAAEGHARVVETGGRVMRAPSEERQLEGDALVQRAERAGAIGRDVVGDEEDRAAAHRSASS
jgi:hypothetical protein